jgi:methylase of polypeptide subunit release factors
VNSLNHKTAVSQENPSITWEENGAQQHLRWHSESGMPAPTRVVIADDTMTADTAYRLACEGTSLLWRGDFQNARQLLQALARRIDKKSTSKVKKAKKSSDKPEKSITEQFHLYRLAQAQRTGLLTKLLIPFDADGTIPLRRAPNVQEACREAYDISRDFTPLENTQPFATSLRELLGIIGAHEWRKNGVPITAINARIHPHYGVFSPIRGEYIDLVAQAPLSASLSAALQTSSLAFDIGTGTGILSMVLVWRGIEKVIATDQSPRALACAQDNINRLGLSNAITVEAADLFPNQRNEQDGQQENQSKAALIVCNPPWLPGKVHSSLDAAIYDPDSQMLKGFLNGVKAHLMDTGEAWLILSDIAEHLGLRSRAELLGLIENAGLCVLDKVDTKAQHPRASDTSDPLHLARAAEVTSLWRLGHR